MKIKTLHEVKYDVETKLIRVREKTGGLWLIDGELYDVDHLHDTFTGNSNPAYGRDDPEHIYQDDFLANAGDLLKVVRTNKGWAVINMQDESGWNYDADEGKDFQKDPYGIIPHNQWDIGLGRFFDEENQRMVEVEFPKVRERIVKRLPKQHNFGEYQNPSVLRNPKVKHKGSGAFGSTYQHQDRPEDVRKITKPQKFLDGYHKYIELLKDNPDFDNPYFPKLREITKYSRRVDKEENDASQWKASDEVVLSVKKEALRSTEELTYEEVEQIFTRWFGEKWMDQLKKITDASIDTLKSWQRFDLIIENMVRNIAKYPENWRGALLDDDLYNALHWLKYKVAQDGVDFDFGGQNIMYKRSPYGIQLVLTDPVA